MRAEATRREQIGGREVVRRGARVADPWTDDRRAVHPLRDETDVPRQLDLRAQRVVEGAPAELTTGLSGGVGEVVVVEDLHTRALGIAPVGAEVIARPIV